MSNEAINWALRYETETRAEGAVLLVLANRADCKGVCFPSVATIAREARYSQRRTKDALRALESKGVIKRLRRHDNDGHRKSDEIELIAVTKVQKLRLGPSAEFVPSAREIENPKVQKTTVQGAKNDRPRCRKRPPHIGEPSRTPLEPTDSLEAERDTTVRNTPNDGFKREHRIPDTAQRTAPSQQPTPKGQGQQSRIAGNDDNAAFDAFWNAYGRKVARGAARKAWRTALKKASAEVIIAGAERHRELLVREGREARYWPHAATWLNGERWMDEVSTPRAAREARPAQEFDWAATFLAGDGSSPSRDDFDGTTIDLEAEGGHVTR